MLDAMRAACANKEFEITAATEILQIVDSLGFFIALTDIQDATGLPLGPPQLLQLLRCRSIADIVAVLETYQVSAPMEPA
ncbi:MAG: hypothetical protein ABW171_15610 [Steroidobacter sp.]